MLESSKKSALEMDKVVADARQSDAKKTEVAGSSASEESACLRGRSRIDGAGSRVLRAFAEQGDLRLKRWRFLSRRWNNLSCKAA